MYLFKLEGLKTLSYLNLAQQRQIQSWHDLSMKWNISFTGFLLSHYFEIEFIQVFLFLFLKICLFIDLLCINLFIFTVWTF